MTSLATVPTPPRLLRPREVAEYMRLSESQIRNLIRSGDLPVVRVRGSVRVDRQRLDAMLDGQPEGAA